MKTLTEIALLFLILNVVYIPVKKGQGVEISRFGKIMLAITLAILVSGQAYLLTH